MSPVTLIADGGYRIGRAAALNGRMDNLVLVAGRTVFAPLAEIDGALAIDGIAVNAVAPGRTETQRLRDQEWCSDMDQRQRPRALVTGQEVSAVIGALLESSVGGVSGTVIAIDAGHSLEPAQLPVRPDRG